MAQPCCGQGPATAVVAWPRPCDAEPLVGLGIGCQREPPPQPILRLDVPEKQDLNPQRFGGEAGSILCVTNLPAAFAGPAAGPTTEPCWGGNATASPCLPAGMATCSRGHGVRSACTESLVLWPLALSPLRRAGPSPEMTTDASRLHGPPAPPSPTALGGALCPRGDRRTLWGGLLCRRGCWESSLRAEIEEGQVNGDREEPKDTAGLGKG